MRFRGIRGGLIGLLSVFAVVGKAHAFSIHDHVELTEIAFLELLGCNLLGDAAQGTLKKNVLDANLDEDLNLIRKWIKYSHYYHPYKKLSMRREDSSVTIEESQAELGVANRSDSELLLGRVIHHFQDSAVPAHVVAITHTSFTDGFEELEVDRNAFARIGDQENCERLKSFVRPAQLMEILRGTAIRTLEALNEPFSFLATGAPMQDTWTRNFYMEGPGDDFGSYGVLGNRFGNPRFWSGRMIEVDPAQYLRFKAGRMRDAVDATELAVLWYLDLYGSRTVNRSRD